MITLHANPGILSYSNKNKATEEDYAIKLWGYIILQFMIMLHFSLNGENLYIRNNSKPNKIRSFLQ
ncbi:hypothetical protein EDC94DRAFT_646499 [Helicostylum pulchrum]|nr:hypothetical protein EDC94DRAFT_646499 [Helicostylum pulchrum]